MWRSSSWNMLVEIYGKDYSMALYLKPQLEYARGDHQKAVRLLMASSNRTEMGISRIYYNNRGCIYYGLGKYHSSAVIFSKALSSSLPLRKEKPLKPNCNIYLSELEAATEMEAESLSG
nr:CCR4-NOT transcription complex subunit 10-like [Ipomoea trifida]